MAAERFQRLRVVVERSALAKHEARVGRIEEVLVEGPSKKDPACCRVALARTSWCTSRRRIPLRAGAYATVEITHGAPHHLIGEFVELLAEPLHKRRIAVLAG